MRCERAAGLLGCWRAATAAAERPRDMPGGALSGANDASIGAAAANTPQVDELGSIVA